MAIDKIIDPSIAANAYANTSKTAALGKGVAGNDGVSFSDFLKDQTADAIKTIKNSETMSARAITGEADLTDVVQAVTAAELTLQTVVAVRDRLVGAYQEIMRMPI
jgi:flagellar hook-basal body complex protein FliE